MQIEEIIEISSKLGLEKQKQKCDNKRKGFKYCTDKKTKTQAEYEETKIKNKTIRANILKLAIEIQEAYETRDRESLKSAVDRIASITKTNKKQVQRFVNNL